MQGVAGDDERRMTIVQHLEELRKVLIWVMGAWIIGTAIAFVFNGFFLGILLHPLHTVLANSHSIIPNDEAIITSPTEGLTVPLKISAVVGIDHLAADHALADLEFRLAGTAAERAEIRRAVHRERTRCSSRPVRHSPIS